MTPSYVPLLDAILADLDAHKAPRKVARKASPTTPLTPFALELIKEALA